MKAITFMDGFNDHKLIVMKLELAYPPRTSGPSMTRYFSHANCTTNSAELQSFSNSFVECFWEQAIEIN